MKHVLGIVKPYLDSQRARVPKVELDYLRLIYAVSEIRNMGETAQGYFVVTASSMTRHLIHLEREYQGKLYAQVLNVSFADRTKPALRAETNEILSGMVKAAVLDKSQGLSAATIQRSIRELVLAETILGLEPDVRQVTDENRFPFGVRWDYYGVVE